MWGRGIADARHVIETLFIFASSTFMTKSFHCDFRSQRSRLYQDHWAGIGGEWGGCREGGLRARVYFRSETTMSRRVSLDLRTRVFFVMRPRVILRRFQRILTRVAAKTQLYAYTACSGF